MGLSTYNGFGPKLRMESFTWQKAKIAAGRIPLPSQCQTCGETEGHLDYHTEDYSKPFGLHIVAYQLCFRCHMMLHARYRRRAAWLRYIEQIEAGAWWPPLMSRAEIGRIAGNEWIENPVGWRDQRGPMTFFRSLSMERDQGDQARLFPA